MIDCLIGACTQAIGLAAVPLGGDDDEKAQEEKVDLVRGQRKRKHKQMFGDEEIVSQLQITRQLNADRREQERREKEKELKEQELVSQCRVFRGRLSGV